MKVFQVDAFTDQVFSGNPAAVIPLKEWPDTEILQKIAAENNLSETAYFKKQESGSFKIRWFTPLTEVDLCGHATLASAHVLFNHLGFSEGQIRFDSNSGELTVRKEENVYWMDFPANPPKPIPVPKLIPEAIGTIPIYCGVNTDLLVLVQDQETIRNLKPDLLILKKMEVRGVIVTAVCIDGEADFVSRFFGPAVGVDEDPVTGSAHTVLAPFWAKKIGKKRLKAKQISKRGGSLMCEVNGNRVLIGGEAVTYMKGEIAF